MINKTIKDIEIEYAVLVYTFEYLNTDNDWDLQFTIDDNFLLEMLLLKVGGSTISYSSSVFQM